MSNPVPLFYLKPPFQVALQGQTHDVIITNDGSAYKGSVAPQNLIISGAGVPGPAGGGNLNVRINDTNTGSISNALEYTRRLGEFMVKNMDLQNASGNYLDYLGEKVFGIPRFLGEIDADYADRVKATIFAIKTTKLSLRDALLPFAGSVEIIEGAELGMFSDVGYSDFFRHLPGPPVVATFASAGGVFGMIFYYLVMLDGVSPEDGPKIFNILQEFKPAGVAYDVIVTSFV